MAPMMDWTNGSCFPKQFNRLGPLKTACLLYVSSKFR